MGRAKLLCGAIVACCYSVIAYVLLGWNSPASSTIAAREAMVRRLSCIYCPLILGGSNSIFGVRARVLDEDVALDKGALHFVNLSLWKEGFSFRNYYAWLSRIAQKPSLVIYSSAKVYSLGWPPDTDNESQRLDGEPVISAFASERLFTRVIGKSTPLEFDAYGDLANYNCSASMTPVEYKRFDDRAAERFVSNVRALQQLYADTPIFLRMPPAYISAAQRQDWVHYFYLLKQYFQRNKVDGLVLDFMPRLLVTKERFCDSPYHVKRDFSEVLSHELANQIIARAPNLAAAAGP